MVWSLSKSSATGVTKNSKIELNPSAPQQFARFFTAANDTSCWQFGAITPLPRHAMKAREIYVREQDLIAHYLQSPDDNYAFQLDWQLLPVRRPFVGGVELWISIQTNFLDTEPLLEVSCLSPDAQPWEMYSHQNLTVQDHSGSADVASPATSPAAVHPAAMVCNAKPGTNCTGLWMIEATDQENSQLSSAPVAAELRVKLFGHFMEKGVIRRARMRFLLSEANVGKAEIAAAYTEFIASPLPLTA